MVPRILLVEDDDDIRRQTSLLLKDEGYEVDEAATAGDAIARFERRPADCVLLDVMLPDGNGFDTCRTLRSGSDVPIIMVTARADTYDVVAGLEAGADDYVIKPFELKELAARIRAMLRRTRVKESGRTHIELGGRVEILPDEGVVRCDGVEVHLTRTEFRLLCEMADNAGRLFSREALLESVWGYEYVGDSKLVDAHVHRLRAKIEQDPANPRHLVTVRGLGYKVTR
ncbi:MAG TPA: response regulator transcription factor [Acidimicrobiales bacterium]|nr:response regulator transcription factor [Acidimicrobiales bacterium]HWI03649.1 response regulator transcription factor [Acidimicrobiales bacterium]